MKYFDPPTRMLLRNPPERKNSYENKWMILYSNSTISRVPCKRRSSVNSRPWLRRLDDVTKVAKTDILR